MRKYMMSCTALLLSLALVVPMFAADENIADMPESEIIVGEPEPEPVAAPFTDIAGHWAEDTIVKWSESGIVNGYPDGTFRPDDPITRAELAKIITLAFGLEKNDAIELDDLNPEEWYCDYVNAAAKYIPSYGAVDAFDFMSDYIKKGSFENGKGSFLPDNVVLRFHAAETFSLLKMEHDRTEIEMPTIQDIHYELKSVYKDVYFNQLYATIRGIPGNVKRFQTYPWLAYKLGIMTGNSEDPDENYFLPYNSLTRAEVLTILDRILTPEEISE